ARAALESATTERDQATTTADEALEAFSKAGGDDAMAKAELELSTATETLAISASKLETAESSAREAEGRLARAEQEMSGLDAAAPAAATQDQRAANAVAEALTAIPSEVRGDRCDDPDTIAKTADLWVTERRILIAAAKRRLGEAEVALDRDQRA